MAAIPILLIALACIALLFYFFFRDAPKLVLATTPFLLLLAKEVHRRLRLKLIKERRYSTERPYTWKVNQQATTEHPDYLKLKNSFSNLFEGESRSILLLIERVTPEDHQAKIYERIYQDLKKENRKVKRYFHRGEYEMFWNEENPDGVKAEDLVAEFDSWTPIFCSDGHRLIDTETKSLSDSIFPFYLWRRMFLLTNRPAQSWSIEEDELSVVFSIISFNLKGVEAMKALLDKRPGLHPFHQHDEKPELILKDDDKNIPQKLEAHYGKELTTWIAGAALCSKLNWKLTMQIGEHLSRMNPNLINHSNRRQLSRLGWFRVEEIPEQVRKQFINYLPESTQQEIRMVIINEMERTPPPAPSHANNIYRMELASHKLQIPDFPQKNLKEEYYELSSMGYIDEVNLTNKPLIQSNLLYDSLPENIKEYAYNKGGALFGWSVNLMVPLLLLFAGTVAITPGSWIPFHSSNDSDPNKIYLTGTITDLRGKTLSAANIVSVYGDEKSMSDGTFSFEIPDSNTVGLIIRKKGFFLEKQPALNPATNGRSIALTPKEIKIKVVEHSDKSKGIDHVFVTVDDALTSQQTGQSGFVKIPLSKDHYDLREVKLSIAKKGYINRSATIDFDEGNFTVLLRREDDQTDPVDATEKLKEYRLKGIVKNGCSQILKNVKVTVKGKSKETRSNGRFELDFKSLASDETIDVTFSLDGYHEASESYELSRIGGRKEIKLAPRSIEVLVIDSKTKKPIKDVTVKLSGSGEKETNRAGECTFDIKKNFTCTSEVSIKHSNYETLNKKTISHIQQPAVIRLKKKGTDPPPPDTEYDFDVEVKNQCKKTIEGVGVRIIGITNTPQKTDSKGEKLISFKHDNPNASIKVEFKKSGFKTKVLDYKVKDLNNQQSVELLKNRIIIKVLDADTGKPIPNVKVEINGEKTTVGSRGTANFLVENPPRCSFIVKASYDGYDPYEKSRGVGERTIDITLKKQTTKPDLCYFKGKVVDQCGNPIAGVTAGLKINSRVITKDDGSFSIPFDCKDNSVRLTLVKSGYPIWNKKFNTANLANLKPFVLFKEKIDIQLYEKGTKTAIPELTLFINQSSKTRSIKDGTCTLGLSESDGCKSITLDDRRYVEKKVRLDISKEPFVIELTPVSEDPPVYKDYIFEVTVVNGTMPLREINVIIMTEKFKDLKFQKTSTQGVFKLRVNRNKTKNLYDYINNKNKLSVRILYDGKKPKDIELHKDDLEVRVDMAKN